MATGGSDVATLQLSLAEALKAGVDNDILMAAVQKTGYFTR